MKIYFIIILLAMPVPGRADLFENDPIDAREICKQYNFDTQLNEMVECLEKVTQKYPNSPRSYYFLAVAYIYADDKKSTKTQYQNLLDKDDRAALALLFAIGSIKPEWVDDYYIKESKRLNKKYE